MGFFLRNRKDSDLYELNRLLPEVKSLCMALQKVKTLIRMLLQEQSDLGLHSLSRHICSKNLGSF